MIDVIDVSRWQGTIDWKKVKASGKVGGVMIRAVSHKNGQPYVDPCFEANYAGAKSVGLPVGVYAYTVAVTEGTARKELNLLKTCLEGKSFELPIDNEQLQQLVSTLITVVVAIINWWKNNSFTKEAIEADELFARLRAENNARK